MIRKTTGIALACTLVACAYAESPVNDLEFNVFAEKDEGTKATKEGNFTWKGEDFDLKTAFYDKKSADWIGAAAIIGTLLWIWSILYYGKTNYSDGTMVYGEPPVAWFWTNLTSTTLGWSAASYLAYFVLYAFISVVEFGSWCAYISGQPRLFGLWANIAQWGTLILYFVPPLFSMLNLVLPATNGGISGGTSAGFINAVMLTVIGFINWLFQWIVHFTFVRRLKDHVQAKDIVILRATCSCEEATGDGKAIEAAVQKCYKKLSAPRCQEIVQNALNEQCFTEEERQNQRENNISLFDCQVAKANQQCGSIRRPEELNNEEYWTLCKATQLVNGVQSETKEDEGNNEGAGDW